MFLSRAQEISRSPSDEVILLVGYGANDNGAPWSVNLAPAAQRLNQMRRFASILLINSAQTAVEQQQIRRMIERVAGSHRRILVVPVLTLPSSGDPNLEQCLQGYSHDVAASGVISDTRLVDWLLSRTTGQ